MIKFLGTLLFILIWTSCSQFYTHDQVQDAPMRILLRTQIAGLTGDTIEIVVHEDNQVLLDYRYCAFDNPDLGISLSWGSRVMLHVNYLRSGDTILFADTSFIMPEQSEVGIALQLQPVDSTQPIDTIDPIDTITPPFTSELGVNLLRNSDFSQGQQDWAGPVLLMSGLRASGSVQSGVFIFNIDTVEAISEYWHLQVTQENIELVHGGWYRIETLAKASRVLDFELVMMQQSSPYAAYHSNGAISLSTEYQRKGLVFRMDSASNTNARLAINAGKNVGRIEIDEISLIRLDSQLIDERDGKTYRTTRIGNQTWMAEDLKYDTLDRVSSWCYNNIDSNCTLYGRLYTWSHAMGLASGYNSISANITTPVQGICPTGWHIPTKDEWLSLQVAVGGSNVAGLHLRAAQGWDGNGGADSYGFSAMANGYFNGTGFFALGGNGLWWSATESSTAPASQVEILRLLTGSSVGSSQFNKYSGCAVRCVKD